MATTLAALRQNLDFLGDMFDTLIKMPPIGAEVSYDPDHARRQHVAALGHDVRELLAKEAEPLTYRNAMLQEKTADLIDHCRSLADQAGSHPVQCLQIKLIVGLHWNAAGGRPLNSLRDRVGVPKVVLVTLPERFGISGRYLPYVMTERN